jgi:cell fate regulator YaaT (PSP1 superfamily)
MRTPNLLMSKLNEDDKLIKACDVTFPSVFSD